MFGIVEWDTLAVTHYLATKPAGIVVFLLVVAALCFFAGGVVAFVTKAFWAGAVAAGLAIFMLAFLL